MSEVIARRFSEPHAENRGHEIEVGDADEAPVERADDDEH